MAAAPLIAPIVSGMASAYGIDQAKQSAKVEAKNRQNVLARRQEDERNALRENTRRRLDEKKRHLAKVRVQNATSGFANSGTQLAVFGEIESRLDESINEATSRSMASINKYGQQIKLSKHSAKIQNKAFRTAQIGNVIKTGTKAAGAYSNNYDRSGYDPFSIYKKQPPKAVLV